MTAWLETASRIGDALCASAVWHGELCNWVGHSADELDPTTRAITATVASLEPDLYAGSAGVGLFLAALAGHTGSASHRRAAAGALRRSRDTAERVASPSWFSGKLGIAYALGVGGAKLGDEALASDGFALAGSTVAITDTDPIDIIGGLAGRILGCLALADIGARDLVEHAVAMARALAQRGRRDDGSWQWVESDDQPSLTGISHGDAGIGLALLEAHAVSGDAALLEAARGAFAHENQSYVPEQRNWIDHRPWVVSAMGDRSCGVTWCHGAPGIALTRVRALELHPAEAGWRGDADAGIRATHDELAQHRDRSELDATLCHGTCGLVETLLASSAPGDRALAEQIAADVAARVAAGREIITGVPSGGANPSLMLGTAGIGWAMLRLHDPTTPSLLGSPRTRLP